MVFNAKKLPTGFALLLCRLYVIPWTGAYICKSTRMGKF